MVIYNQGKGKTKGKAERVLPEAGAEVVPGAEFTWTEQKLNVNYFMRKGV